MRKPWKILTLLAAIITKTNEAWTAIKKLFDSDNDEEK
jgi:hypothetical protein